MWKLSCSCCGLCYCMTVSICKFSSQLILWSKNWHLWSTSNNTVSNLNRAVWSQKMLTLLARLAASMCNHECVCCSHWDVVNCPEYSCLQCQLSTPVNVADRPIRRACHTAADIRQFVVHWHLAHRAFLWHCVALHWVDTNVELLLKLKQKTCYTHAFFTKILLLKQLWQRQPIKFITLIP